MPKTKLQKYRMEQVYGSSLRAHKANRQMILIRLGCLDIKLCSIMKELLVRDFEKILVREDFYVKPNPLNDLSDDHFSLNLCKCFQMTNNQLMRRDGNHNSLLNFINRRNTRRACKKQNIGLCIYEGPVQSGNYFLMSTITAPEKRNPFSLLHLSAVEVTKQVHTFALDALSQIHNILRHRNLAVRVGKDDKRYIFHVHSLIKQHIHKYLDQEYLCEAYFDNVALNPTSFCLWCDTKLNEKIYAKTATTRYDCTCRLCKFLRLGISKTTVVEINGHLEDCPNQKGLSH